MSTSHRRYNFALAAVLGPVLALLAITTFYLEPYDGGLTRLGGYPEKEYGWNEPQRRFDPPLYRQFMTREATYREPVDVVVLGDSFTFDDRVSWPNYFVQQTGLSLHAFRIDKTPVDTLMQSERFRRQPPRILIFETVERELWNRLQDPHAGCAIRPPPSIPPLSLRPMVVAPQPFVRNTNSTGFDLSLGIDFLSKVVPREYFGRDRTPVLRLDLRQPAPFSSREKSKLLVYRDDLDKARWTTGMWETIRCNLATLQNRVQDNGRTYFVTMVAPDKLTAYDRLLIREELASLSRIDLLVRDRALHLPRFDTALRNAVRFGTRDVYLNNDTHWGSAGHERVAQELVDYLVREGVLGR